jgi:hypothetical protein
MAVKQVVARRADSAKHREALRTSSHLINLYRRMYRPMAAKITPKMVIKVLQQAGVKCLLMGAHGIGGWKEQARSTEDIDLLVPHKVHAKAVKALQMAFPQLAVSDLPVVTRFSDKATGKEVIDLMKPVEDLFKVAFKYSIPVGNSHRVPDLEMALVAKFAAMVSPYRRQKKKLVDGADFIDMVENNLKEIDLKKLRKLAEKVYPGGGTEVSKLIEDITAGRRIEF